jgi:branched-chain amino acid aminotransferase
MPNRRSEGHVDEPATNLVYFEGALVPESEAKISVLSPAISRGPVAYETMRGYWNEDHGNLYLFRLRDHLARLNTSMKILRFQELFNFEEMRNWILDVVRANKIAADMHIRILVYPVDQDGPGRTSAQSGIVISAEPRPAGAPDLANCQVSSWLRRGGDNHPARVKAVGLRMFARTALAQAEIDGYTDLIIQDDRGKIIEATSSNVFIVRHEVLVTPTITDQILEGITRDTIIAIAGDLGISCCERVVDRTELYDCEEAFLCSTGLEVLPISTVDGLPVASGAEGKITQAIRSQYLSLVRGAVTTKRAWRTSVY